MTTSGRTQLDDLELFDLYVEELEHDGAATAQTCYGTLGSVGCMGGCGGTFGTFGTAS